MRCSEHNSIGGAIGGVNFDAGSGELNVLGVDYSKIRDALEIVLFVKSQNLRNAIVFHNDAVNYVADPEWYLRIPCLTW